MKFKQVKQDAASFTHLTGYVTLTRGELVRIFGEPAGIESLDGKITTEWVLEFADKTVATIYDYKRYELGAPGAQEVYEWHVGGFSNKSLQRVIDEIETYRRINAAIQEI